mgnify:CR=1 FL=1
MINGCAGSDSNQSINSLSHLEKERFEGGKDGVGGEPSERVFDFNVNRGRSTSTIYFSDCGYDGLCPGDENYKGADEGELDNKFNCEPFDCGVDGFCSEDYYSFYSLDRPDGYKYSGPDKGEGDYSGFDGKDEFFSEQNIIILREKNNDSLSKILKFSRNSNIEIINNNALIFELSRKTISLNPEFEPFFSSLKSAPGQHSIAIPENILEKSSMLTSLRPLEGSTMTARL